MKKIFLMLVLVCASAVAQVTIKGNDVASGNVIIGANVVSVQTASLPGGTQGLPYSQTLTASGGQAPYTWALAIGLTPPSTSLSSSGVIAGTPTAAGTFSFSVVATDQNGVASNPRPLSITIVSGATLTINNTSFPNFPFGQAYGQPINVTGGSGTGYVCSLHSGALPSGVTVSTNCTIGLTATSVGGSIGANFTYSLHVVDSASNTFNTGNFTTTVIQPCGPPNYGCAGRSVVNDNCIMQIFGGGASAPGCPPTPASIPNLNNGSSTCTQGTNCSTTDAQFNNVQLTRCTDATLNGTISVAPFLNRPYNIGAGGSGDTNAFTTDSSMMAVFDSGNRFIIETIDTTAHTCYPILNGAALFLPGPGEFSSKTKGHYFSFYPGSTFAVNLFSISCTTPGHSSVSCSGLGSSTVVADFAQAFPQVTATQWTASTSYSYGQYVFTYLTNSQCVGAGCPTPNGTLTATCNGSGTATYTLSPGLAALEPGMMFSVSGLSTFNVAGATIVTANGPGTIITASTGCSSGTATGSGAFKEGSNVLFQNTTLGTHTSGSGTPSWNTGALNNTTDSGITWINSGTTNFFQGGGWVTIGGVSVDETQFSGGFSNNNFDTAAKGAINITMNGNQNTGFLVYTYDSTANVYNEWNTGSGIIKSFTCSGGTGPTCALGSFTVATVGQVNISATTPCGSTPCQMYLHNVKILKGGAWNEITPEFCASKPSGVGACPTGGKYFWQKSTTTINMATVTNGGHETERYTHADNMIVTGTGNAYVRQVTAPNVSPGPAAFWVNSNVTGDDGHWGAYYLNGSTDDTTTTPIAGATDNTSDFPYTTPFESEVIIIPTCGVLTPFTTPACSGSELQTSQVAREAHTYATGTCPFFNCQFAVGAFSQDGTIYGLTTDWACQFGSSTGAAVLCGFPWAPSFGYTSTSTISPTGSVGSTQANAGGYVYRASGTCTSGTVSPAPFSQVVGGTTTDGTCTWTNLGVSNERGDVVLVFLQ